MRHGACPRNAPVTKVSESAEPEGKRAFVTFHFPNDNREIMKDRTKNFESIQKLLILHLDLDSPTVSIGFHSPTTMENPVDRTIRLMAFAAGVVSLLVFAVFHFV